MTAGPPGLTPFARRCIAAGALLMLLGVILGAFGTHLLAARLEPKQFASFQTGVLYHLLHALGLLLVGAIAQAGGETRWLRAAAVCMLAGIACFSGAIYLITAGAPRSLGMVAPLGGLSFMAAWASLALHARTRAQAPTPTSSTLSHAGVGEGAQRGG
jgi:uncharacterized membrane protein YgdD (TMEM256/DUF423 family)